MRAPCPHRAHTRCTVHLQRVLAAGRVITVVCTTVMTVAALTAGVVAAAHAVWPWWLSALSLLTLSVAAAMSVLAQQVIRGLCGMLGVTRTPAAKSRWRFRPKFRPNGPSAGS